MKLSMICSLYARVSSTRQAQEGTIGSQIEAIKDKIMADGGTLPKEMLFIDEGVSGATLIRPELERLRDTLVLGGVDRVYLLSPDRLARKYAHQALLLEEIASAGVTVHFLNHAVGTTPEEKLLLQMQGMIAEYERAKIIERHRRGKLHRAKNGSVNVLSGAPYGYDYIRRQLTGEAAQYVINLVEAKTVRQVFQWIGIERLSIGEVCRRLTEAGIPTRTGKAYWDRSVIWGMLQNPAYMGKAAFGKTKAGELKARVRPQKRSAETPKKPYSTHRTRQEDWIVIPVPPIRCFRSFNNNWMKTENAVEQENAAPATCYKALLCVAIVITLTMVKELVHPRLKENISMLTIAARERVPTALAVNAFVITNRFGQSVWMRWSGIRYFKRSDIPVD